MKATPEKKAAFLAALAESGGSVKHACDAIEIHRGTAYRWRDEDFEFRANWDRAKRWGGEALEDEARRRALVGVDEPVFYAGSQCGTVRRFSDTLLIFLLKGAMPEKYRERIEHSGSVDIGAAILAARGRTGVGDEGVA